MRDKTDHSGEVHGRLTLLSKNGNRQEYWCSCSCGKYTKDNPKLIPYTRMASGNTHSCGCLHHDVTSKMMKERRTKHNTYDLYNEYGICYDDKMKNHWLFDLEDYDKIKDYYWYSNHAGYATAKDKQRGTTVIMSRIIMGLDIGDKLYVDHINHNVNDNRKTNLRVCTNSQNNMNKGLQSNNTSGVTGVTWFSRDNKWAAQIKINGKHIHLGLFNNISDAIAARKAAEEKYFGKYSYDNSMTKEK